jgi:hypothetical protein
MFSGKVEASDCASATCFFAEGIAESDLNKASSKGGELESTG